MISDSIGAVWEKINFHSRNLTGIYEDRFNNVWLSCENGLIRLGPENSTTEIFNNFNGLGFNNFSENTCFKRNDGSLVVIPWLAILKQVWTG